MRKLPVVPEKRCPRCGVVKPRSEYYRNAGRHDGVSTYCVPCYAALNNDLARRNRADLIAALGGACERCGFDDPRALQVDHVKGRDGPRGNVNTRKWYAHVLAHPDEFQLLCANCNVIKRIEEREHIGTRDYGRVPPE